MVRDAGQVQKVCDELLKVHRIQRHADIGDQWLERVFKQFARESVPLVNDNDLRPSSEFLDHRRCGLASRGVLQQILALQLTALQTEVTNRLRDKRRGVSRCDPNASIREVTLV